MNSAEQLRPKNAEAPSDPEKNEISPEDIAKKRFAELSGMQQTLEAQGNITASSENPSKYEFQEKLDAITAKGREYLKAAMDEIAAILSTKEFADFIYAIPFAGGATQALEGEVGVTLQGKHLSPIEGAIRKAGGVADLALDCSGVGEAEKGTRLAFMGKKIAEEIKRHPKKLQKLIEKIASRYLGKS